MDKRILIIEDDADLREGLGFSLGLEGYQVYTAETIKEGLEILKKYLCDVLLLDCNLPDGSGYDLCSVVKDQYGIPILMLTARDTEMDEVKALELGMDDFMTKPFSLAVLKARIKKLIGQGEQLVRLASNGISIDQKACKVYRGEEEIVCSKMEYQLLCYLIENRNHVLSKAQIMEHLWDSKGRFVDDNTVSVNIRRLRTKIEEDPKNPQWIKTVHGIGYCWEAGEV